MPTYDGPVDGNEKFDPSRLSAVAAQVKFKAACDKKAELAIRPTVVPRDRRQPLPYLALLMELGSESEYQESSSKIRCTASEPLPDGKFEEYCDALDAAEEKLASHPKRKDTNILNNLKKRGQRCANCHCFLQSVLNIGSWSISGCLWHLGHGKYCKRVCDAAQHHHANACS